MRFQLKAGFEADVNCRRGCIFFLKLLDVMARGDHRLGGGGEYRI
jgi:hypothetical protein